MKTFLTLAGFPVIILAVWYLVRRAKTNPSLMREQFSLQVGYRLAEV